MLDIAFHILIKHYEETKIHSQEIVTILLPYEDVSLVLVHTMCTDISRLTSSLTQHKVQFTVDLYGTFYLECYTNIA